MSLVEGDRYYRKFVDLLSMLNKNRMNKTEYYRISERICTLVGEMIGEIDDKGSDYIRVSHKTEKSEEVDKK